MIGQGLFATTPNLYGQSVNIISHEIPEPSGGSQIGSRLSSEGAYLGPDSWLGVTPESAQVPTPGATIGATFEGFGFDDNATENGGFVFIPPDTMGAAGTDRLIAVVNTMIEARTKAGALLWRDSLADFFSPLAGATLGTFTFDPKVVYDQFEDRFVVVTLEQNDTFDGDSSNESRILLAVSKTATPASATAVDWNYHAIDSKTTIGVDHWADYPGFEVDEEAVYITNNMFSFGGAPAFGGVRLWIVDKGVVGGFYGGGAAGVTVHDPYAGGGTETTTMPCHVFGAGGVPGAGMIGTFLVSYSGLTSGGDEFVQVVRVDDPLGTPTFTQEFVNVGDIEGPTFPALPDAPQSGTGVLIEVNDRRALDCVWRDNAAWLTTTILPNSGPDAGETTAHWFELDTTAVPGGAITLADQGDIGGEDIASDTTTFFPSVAVNSQGTAQFGFSASASTIFAGAFVAGREVSDPPGTVQASQTVHAGEDFYVRTFGGPKNRWGDYSGISLDPAADDLFWVCNQFADTRGTIISGEDGRWGTACAVVVTEPIDHFLCYKVKAKPKFAKFDVGLADQFENKPFTVKTAVSLCNPADKNSGGIIDPVSHLKGYKIKRAKGEPKHVKQTNIKVENQFGTIFVDTKKPDRLLLPTAKSLVGPVPQLDPVLIDHFKCYKVKTRKRICEDDPSVKCKTNADCDTGACNLGFPKGITVTVDDQFPDTPKVFKVKKPTRLCTPVDKNGGGILDPLDHLMCYKVKRAKGEPKHTKVSDIHTNNQFGAEVMKTKKLEELCVPSVKTLP